MASGQEKSPVEVGEPSAGENSQQQNDTMIAPALLLLINEGLGNNANGSVPSTPNQSRTQTPATPTNSPIPLGGSTINSSMSLPPTSGNERVVEELQNEGFGQDISSIDKLKEKLNVRWESITRAYQQTLDTQRKLTTALQAHCESNDMSIAILGSLGRGEYTAGSDIDWYLLIDGQQDSRHRQALDTIRQVIGEIAQKPVGREGIFDTWVFSQYLVHNIGNEGDSVSNLARRMALLIESHIVGNSDAYERVLNSILNRYLSDGDFWGNSEHHVPRILLNEFSRFKSTMEAGTHHRHWDRAGRGSVIRFIKLNMSRKLLYASGLLVCFSFHTHFTNDERQALFNNRNDQSHKEQVFEHIKSMFAKRPLEIVADVLLRYNHLNDVAKTIMNSYDTFLQTLMQQRDHLEQLSFAQKDNDRTYKDALKFMEDFHEGLINLFLDEESGLKKLFLKYACI